MWEREEAGRDLFDSSKVAWITMKCVETGKRETFAPGSVLDKQYEPCHKMTGMGGE
jgi:hypothetical protein